MLRANDSRRSDPTQRRGSCSRQRNFSLRSSICRTTPRSVSFGEEAADDGTSCGTGTEAGLAAALIVLGRHHTSLLASERGPRRAIAASRREAAPRLSLIHI